MAANKELAPIILATDFNDQRSNAECKLRVGKVYEKHGVQNPLKEANSAVIISIDDIRQFNVTDGAYTICQLASGINEKTPAIITGVVDPGVGGERKGIAVRTKKGHDFVGPDNGLFTPVFEHEGGIKKAYAVKKNVLESVPSTFHGRDVFVPVAAERSLGFKFDEISSLEEIDPDKLVKKPFVSGQVVNVDGTGNVKMFDGVPCNKEGEKATDLKLKLPKRIFQRGIPRRDLTVPVVSTFGDVQKGRFLALEGSSGRNGNAINGKEGTGFVEVAINQGDAAKKLRLEPGDQVGLEWKFPKKEFPLKQRITTVFKRSHF